MSNTVYHEQTPPVKPLTWPPAIRAEHVEYLLAVLPGARVTIESTHPAAANWLTLPDGAVYETRNGAWWHLVQ